MSVDQTTIIMYLQSDTHSLVQQSVTVSGVEHDGIQIVSVQFEFESNCHTMSAASARKMAHMLLEAAGQTR